MMIRRHLTVIGVLLGITLLLPLAAAAQQDSPLQLAVRDTRLLDDGVTELVVNVTGPAKEAVLPVGAFRVTEQGTAVGDLDAEPLLESGLDQLTVMLVLDLSSSMRGDALQQMQAAASESVRVLTDQGIPVGILEFHEDVTVRAQPTADTGVLLDAIAALETDVGTALHAGIIVALDELDAAGGIGNVIVFSDGEDNRSAESADEVIAAAGERGIPLTVVALETGLTDLSVLAPLANDTGGRLLRVGDTADLAEVFAEVTDDVASQYLLRYTSTRFDVDTLDLAVTVVSGGAEASTSYVVPNTRQASVATGPRLLDVSPGSWFDGSVGLIAGALATFTSMLLLFGFLFAGARTRGDRVLEQQLSSYIDDHDLKAGRSGAVTAHFRDRAFELFESAPRPKGFDEKLTRRLEQAAWPLRNSEFVALVVFGALGVGVLAAVLTNILGGLLLGIIAGMMPILILEHRRSKRHDAFVSALPDTLQLMAGSLRAGYGVLQAIDTVAQEAHPPTSEEFGRVLTESRLGMPMEEALAEMAERIDNADFRWVVLAINIQREVGGNLAELLDTVAEVLREREMLRRQVKVLSAEGRLSAIILVGLPILLAIYLILVRPEYIGVLVTSGAFGWLLVGGGVFLMAVGIIWIRNLIRIEV